MEIGRYVPSKRWFTFNGFYCVISQKTELQAIKTNNSFMPLEYFVA
jgi:hypothetical protein